MYPTVVNVGIVGLGFMGATHATTYAAMPDVRIAAVFARNEEALRGDFSHIGGNLGLKLPNVDFSATTKHQRWQDLVADPVLDAVDVCAPTDLHAPVTIAALKAGKHVLCEKPMALTADDCNSMLAAAQQTGRVLMIGHVLRFHPGYKRLRNWVLENGRSAIRSAVFTRFAGLPDWSSWLPQAEKSGGAILDLLIHDLDEILHIFGVPKSVSARRAGDPDGVEATFSYQDGLKVELKGGWLSPETPFSMDFRVQTNEGLLSLQDTPGANADPFAEELSYFVNCCKSGTKPDRCPPEESASAVKLALLLKRSRDMNGTELPCVL